MCMCEALHVMSDEGANKKLEERNMSTIPFETHPDWLLVNEKSISHVNRHQPRRGMSRAPPYCIGYGK